MKRIQKTKDLDYPVEVVSNKGSHGIDGMRVEMPKPNGGVRLLGIQTVVDRLIQNKTITNQRLINHGFKSLTSQYERVRLS